MQDNEWQPTYRQFDERRVRLCDGGVTAVKNKGEICIYYQMDDEEYRGGGAIFWKAPSHVYLRLNWHTWITVSCESPEVLKDISKRRTATLEICSNDTIVSHPLRIHRIAELPKELFGDQHVSDDMEIEDIEEIEDSETFEPPPCEPETSKVETSEGICARSKDTCLAMRSKAQWSTLREFLKQVLADEDVDHFDNVKLGNGRVDDAFSTPTVAVLVDAYKGRSSLQDQIHGIDEVAKELKVTESDNRILKAIFFSSSDGAPELPDDFLALFPDNFNQVISWFKKP